MNRLLRLFGSIAWLFGAVWLVHWVSLILMVLFSIGLAFGLILGGLPRYFTDVAVLIKVFALVAVVVWLTGNLLSAMRNPFGE
jgi:hypothetical protein